MMKSMIMMINNKMTSLVNTYINISKEMEKNKKNVLIVIQNYFKNIVFYYIIII